MFANAQRIGWARAPFWLALVSMGAYWASIPPVGFKYAIFFVPAIWTALIDRSRDADAGSSSSPPSPPCGWVKRLLLALPRFFSRGEYRQYWLASFFFWLATLVWVSYPHPATTLGWLALAGYLAFYFPLFIFETRALKRFLRVPTWLGAPLAWTSCEALRNVVMGGFSFAGLSHALYSSPTMIQLAEALGEYGVGAMIVLIGSLYGVGLRLAFSGRVGTESNGSAPKGSGKGSGRSASTRLICFSALVFLANALYGSSRIARLDELEAESSTRNARPLRVAILQDGTSFRFPLDKELNRSVCEKYLALATEASKNARGWDLIVWPEGTYRDFFFDFPQDFTPLFAALEKEERGEADATDALAREHPVYASSADRAEARETLLWARDEALRRRRAALALAERLGSNIILGESSAVFSEDGGTSMRNSAILAPYLGRDAARLIPDETILQSPATGAPSLFRRYDKIDLVMFGEYVPFLRYLPDSWGLKAVCSELTLDRGEGPCAFEIVATDASAKYVLAPHICFESSIPHSVTNQLATLRAANADPDVLVCISSDGWFRNGSETDLHLATQIFRAVENRRSVVAATHGGFSAWIDPCGRVRACGARGNTEVVEAEIPRVKMRPQGLLRAFGRDVCLFDWVRRMGIALFVALASATLVARVWSSRRAVKAIASAASTSSAERLGED